MHPLKFLKNISALKNEIPALIRAYSDVRTPSSIKFFITLITVVYIVSPVDLTPDIIPIIGFLDDIFIFPLLLWIMIPSDIMKDSRRQVTIDYQRPHNHRWIMWTTGVILLGCMIYTYILLVN